jgi:hypothetical protein
MNAADKGMQDAGVKWPVIGVILQGLYPSIRHLHATSQWDRA